MNCPHCGHTRSKIIETRGPRRRHLCCGCGKKFTSLGGTKVFVDLVHVGRKNLKNYRPAQ